MVISKRQLAANRANAKKSTGPRSKESKEKVAQNATKHGLSGAHFQVLSCEDQKEYDALFERFIEAEKPVDDVERELVVKMARHTWLSDRAIRFQEGCFLIQPQTPEREERGKVGVAVRTDLEMYIRYQAANDRAYARAAAELAKRRKDRVKAQNGFVSQKRAEAAEQRREAQENRAVERHKYAVAREAERLEREIILTAQARAKSAAAAASQKPLETAPSASPVTQDYQRCA
jgi:hypothetical protein